MGKSSAAGVAVKRVEAPSQKKQTDKEDKIIYLLPKEKLDRVRGDLALAQKRFYRS